MRSHAQQLVMATSLAAMLVAVPALVNAHEFDTKSAWLPEVEQLYRPDMHYSQASATDSLVRSLAERIEHDGDKLLKVRCADDGLCDQVVRALEKAGWKHGTGGITLVAHVSTGENLEQAVSFRVPDRDIELTAPFVTKPWVSDTPESSFIVVRGLASGDLVGKSRDVIAQAIESEILPRVRKAVREEHFPRSAWANLIARRRAMDALEDSAIIVDRFRQTFYTSIDGDEHVALVREAVLLDLSEENMDGIVHPIVRDLHRVRRRRSTAIGFAAVAVVLVLCVSWIGYTFFNRITQGYYVWPIRFATAAVLVVSVTLAARIALSILNSM